MNRAVLAALVSLTFAGAVRAQDSADDARKSAALEEARQHVARAKVHYDLGEFKEAADEYILVYRLRPIPAILFNVAQAYRQGGIYDKALQFYKSYLRESPDAKNRAMIEQAIKDMDSLLAKDRHTKDAAPKGVKEPAEASLPMASVSPAKPAQPPKPEPAPHAVATTQQPQKEPPKVVPPPQAGGSPASGPAVSKRDVAAPSSPVIVTSPAGQVASNTSKAIAVPTRHEPVVAAARPAAALGTSSTATRSERDHTWTWVAAGASVLALGGGAAFGYKTINGGAPSDARTANMLYGAGAVLAIATAALFVFEF